MWLGVLLVGAYLALIDPGNGCKSAACSPS